MTKGWPVHLLCFRLRFRGRRTIHGGKLAPAPRSWVASVGPGSYWFAGAGTANCLAVTCVKIENNSVPLTFAITFLSFALSSCSVAFGHGSPLKVRWTTVSQKIITTISSQTTHEDDITLKLSGTPNSGPKSRPLIDAVSDSESKFITLRDSQLNSWKYGGYTPLMVVSDKSMFDHRVLYLKADANGTRKTYELNPIYVDVPKTSHNLWWMLIPESYSTAGATITISFVQHHSVPSRYFTGSSVWPNRSLPDVSGCTRVADGLPYAEDSGKWMEVTPYGNAGSGFHGWCYRNKNLSGPYSKANDYFSVSTASSWADVAEFTNRQFTHVEGIRSRTLPRIATKLNLTSGGITDKQKIAAIRTWMANNLKYSELDSQKAAIPNEFDTIISNHGGDCTDMVLVMVSLLHAAGVDAHPALTSMTLPHAFNLNSANLAVLDHIVVYLPKYHHFIDATARTEAQQSYLAAQQVLDVVTDKILEPSKDQVRFF